MRKFFTTLKSVVAATVIAAMALATSCSYDDTDLRNEVNKIQEDLTALTERVAALESKLQSEIDAVKALVDGQVVIVDVTTDADGNQTIKLSDGKEITVLKPTECTCEPAEPCQCDPLKYRTNNDGVLEVSADGENWVAINGVTAESVVANVVVENGIATITLADGTEFTTAVAELVEFEAAKSALYVKVGEAKSINFAINDAVEDINVMNQPLGWKASIEAPTRAVGGMDYVLNITAPSKEFAQYADKSGKVAIHFNTAAGACKVMSIDVELASIDLQVDKAGNITITSTVVDEYDYTDWYGETEHIVEFNNFYLAVFDLDTYYEINGDLESVYNSSWGEFNIPAAAGWINNIVTNIGDNTYEEMTYVDGVNEEWTINATVQNVLKNLDWYGQLPYEGNSFMVCVIPTDIDANGAPVWSETIAVPFKQLTLSIEENVENRVYNNAYFNVTLRGGSAYYLYPASKADVDMYVYEYGYYDSVENYFWGMLESYLQYPDWYSFGFKIASDVVEPNIALSDLLAYTSSYYYFETKPATEYYMCLFVEEDGKTEYTIEDLKFYEFSTADLTLAETPFEVTYEMDEDWSLYTIGVNVTVPETTATVYSRWYAEEMEEADLKADLIANGYAREQGDFEDGGYTYYLGTSVDAPATTKYLGLLVIDAQGNYTLKQFELKSKDIVMNDAEFTIESVEFTPTAVTVTLAGLEGLEVKNYKYYFISTTGGSYYQKTEEQCQDIAYSSDWLYKSTTGYPIIITSTADYKYSFSDGTYKLAVGVEFADGSFSKCVYGEYTYTQPAEELASVVAAYQENDPNYYALTLTTAAGDVITTTAGNGGVNYLNEGVWDYQLYYSSGYALGNTYMNGTTWVSDIKITVAYVDGKYDLTVNSSVGKYHYYGDIEGLVVPGSEGGDDSGDEPEMPNFTFTAATVCWWSNWADFQILFSNEDGIELTCNFWNCSDDNYLAEGTYWVGNGAGMVYTESYSFIDLNDGGSLQDLQGGKVIVAEVDGQYQFTFEGVYYGSLNDMDNLKQFNGSYVGNVTSSVSGVADMVVPSQYVAPEPPAVGETIELTCYAHYTTYGGGQGYSEHEIGFQFDGDYSDLVIDFYQTDYSAIAAGTKTLGDATLNDYYCKYGGKALDKCVIEVSIADDGTYTFDGYFECEGNAYHFTYSVVLYA